MSTFGKKFVQNAGWWLVATGLTAAVASSAFVLTHDKLSQPTESDAPKIFLHDLVVVAHENKQPQIRIHDLVVEPTMPQISEVWDPISVSGTDLPSATNADAYTDEQRRQQAVPRQDSGNNKTFGQAFSREGSPNAAVVIGSDATEPYFGGSPFNDVFVTGKNQPSQMKTSGADDSPVTQMFITDASTTDTDTVILPDRLQDYRVVPVEPYQIDQSKGQVPAFDQTIVLERLHPVEEPNKGLERIVVSGVENLVFTGDADARAAIHKAMEGNRLNSKEAVDAFLKTGNFETTTLEDLHQQMIGQLSAEQLDAYKRVPEELYDEYKNTGMLVRKLVSLQEDGQTDQYDKLFRYMTGQGGDPKEILRGSQRELRAFYPADALRGVIEGGPESRSRNISDMVMRANVKNWQELQVNPLSAFKGPTRTSPLRTAASTTQTLAT